MKDYTPCDKCTKTPGYRTENGIRKECDCLRVYHKYTTLVKYLQGAGIPSRYVEYSISDYLGKKSTKSVDIIKKIASEIKVFVSEGMQLYLFGKPYTQKTSLACYLGRKAAMSGKTVSYITMPRLMQELQISNFSKEYDEALLSKSKLSGVRTADLLILDNAFDTKKVYLTQKTGYYLSLIEELFRFRLENNKSQVYVSTERRHDIDNKFGGTLRLLLNKECLEIELLDKVPPDIMNRKVLSLIGEEINDENNKEKAQGR